MPEHLPIPDLEPKGGKQDSLPLNQVLCGDNLALIRNLPDSSIQLVITSPPYFQQRDYGAGLGNEASVEEYIANLLPLFRECVRVVKPEGSLVFEWAINTKTAACCLFRISSPLL